MQTMESGIVSPQTRMLHLRDFLNRHILGQKALTSRLLVALLADGHLLVEGAPGLAKTRAIKALASRIDASFHRIQFTPDLLPGDLTGSDIFHPEDLSFVFQPGPIFHHVILADEINRAPAKVQSALLEAMAERQVTMGTKTYPLPELFLVMATQNAIEHEGTYPLPEAQLDRFLMYVTIDYPSAPVEREILALARRECDADHPIEPPCEPVTQADLLLARKAVSAVHMSSALEDYLINIVLATRVTKAQHTTLGSFIRYGASPRATIALDRCAKAFAWLAGREYVTPADVQEIAHDVLRHRIVLRYEAEAEGLSPDDVIDMILREVPVP